MTFASLASGSCWRRSATLAVSAVAGEQESTRADLRSIGEIVVIGSRGRIESRADELPVPVDLHHGLDVERTGEMDLGAALTKLAPSFNYTRLSVGDGALHNAATLRAGAGRRGRRRQSGGQRPTALRSAGALPMLERHVAHYGCSARRRKTPHRTRRDRCCFGDGPGR